MMKQQTNISCLKPIPVNQLVRKPDGGLAYVVSCSVTGDQDGWRLHVITRTSDGQPQAFWSDELVCVYD